MPAWGPSVLFKDTEIKLAKPILVLSDEIAVTASDSGLRVSGLTQIGESCGCNKMQDRIIESTKGLFGEFTFFHYFSSACHTVLQFWAWTLGNRASQPVCEDHCRPDDWKPRIDGGQRLQSK